MSRAQPCFPLVTAPRSLDLTLLLSGRADDGERLDCLNGDVLMSALMAASLSRVNS